MSATRPHRWALRTMIAAPLALAITVLGALTAPMPAQAVEIADAITDVRIVEDSVTPTGRIRIELDWEVPNSAVAGDTFTMPMPTNLNVQALTFPLLDAAGDLVANATVNDSQLVVTLSDYVDTHDDVGGTAFFEARFDGNEIQPGTNEDVAFTAGGRTFTDTVFITPIAPNENAGKWMDWWGGPPPFLTWGVHTPKLTPDLIGQSITITDTTDPSGANPIDCSTVQVTTRYYRAGWGDLVNQGAVPATITCTPTSVTATIVVTQELVDRAGTQDDLGRVLVLGGRSDIVNPRQSQFTNTGVVTVAGQAFPVSATRRSSTGGGTGAGAIRVSVGDFVWLDTDRDGVQDAAEPGIAGVTMTLRLQNPDGSLSPVIDVNGLPVQARQTDANGLYTFIDLPPTAAGERYVVVVTPPAGMQPTVANGAEGVANDSSTGQAISVALTTNGQRDATLDFGFWSPTPAIDIEKVDADGNDADTAADAVALPVGDADLTFTVTNSGSEDLVGVEVTDTVVTGGTVTGLACTFPDGSTGTTWAGPFTAGDTFDCSADLTGVTPGTPHEDVATVTAAGETTGIDVTDTDAYHATVPVVSVGDLVWWDQDRDGLQDAGEPGIDGVTVSLTGPGGAVVTDVFGNPVDPTTTAADGAYNFANLPPLPAGQHYSVTVTDPAGWQPTAAGGTAGVGDDSSTGSAESVDLTTDGAADTTLDFGFIRPEVLVGDEVWLDQNHDGIQDAGEPGIQGVQLTISGPGGAAVTDVFGNRVGPVFTAADGTYRFEHLPVLAVGETYTVTVTDPAGHLPTIEGGTPGTEGDSSTGTAQSLTLTTDGGQDLTLDFGFWIPTPTIDIEKFDADANDADTATDAATLPDGTTTLTFTIENNGAEPLVDVTITDTVVTGGTVADLACTFPDGTTGTTWAGPFAVGDTFDCTADLTGLAPGTPHEDVATVTAAGETTGSDVSDTDAYHATRPAAPATPPAPTSPPAPVAPPTSNEPGPAGTTPAAASPRLPVTGGAGVVPGLLAALALGATGMVLATRRRA